MKKISTLLILVLLSINIVFAQSIPPKREFRAAWIATVDNLDWPSTTNNSATQKQELITLLDGLKAANINVVIFQVRTECDALYQSNIDPWSYHLTRVQGQGPSPMYDPLQFAIEEAHKRGMEIHAWFNPYRSVKKVGNYALASNHVSVLHPNWNIQIGTFKFLDPGIPDVMSYVTSVVLDVVSRYDVDGIHMDDYFYPYDGIQNQDDGTFATYPRGYTNKNDWRRNNVNMLINMIHDTIQTVKPHVKFGMSPFGIWKNGVPPGIIGLSAYDDIYCDALNWVRNKNIDYLTPQLYWKIGGNQDYVKLSNWWADSTYKYGVHFYPGQAYHNVSTWTASEIPNQIRLNRGNPKTGGQVFFRTGNVLGNPKGVTDSLKNDLFRTKAILPVMSWKDMVSPNVPQNLRYDRLPGKPLSGLLWDKPVTASDGDTAKFYVIYNTTTSGSINITNPTFILDILDGRQYIPKSTSGVYFALTALDENYNESLLGTQVQITAPGVPVNAFPANNSAGRDTVIFKWSYGERAGNYQLQVSENENFSTLLVNNTLLYDTTFSLTQLKGQTKYYWRVRSQNPAGLSNYSEVWNFTTGFPLVPVLALPTHATLNTELTVQMVWRKVNTATKYRFQFSKSSTFNSLTILKDTVVTDTTFTIENLAQDTYYFWRAAGVNEYGISGYPTAFGFKTKKTTDVEENETLPANYGLNQNYPNPFNPSTIIGFQLPQSSYVSLKVYNAIGNQVAVLVDETKSAGSHNVEFDASKLPSGIYIYTLNANGKVFSKKMSLIK